MSALDLSLVNFCQSLPALGSSNHSCISLILTCGTTPPLKLSHRMWFYTVADWDQANICSLRLQAITYLSLQTSTQFGPHEKLDFISIMHDFGYTLVHAQTVYQAILLDLGRRLWSSIPSVPIYTQVQCGKEGGGG